MSEPMGDGLNTGKQESNWSQLDKVDILRERMGLTYQEAETALAKAEWDLVRALVKVEREQGFFREPEEREQGGWEGLREKWQRLKQTRVNLKHEERTLLSVSAPVGLLIAGTFMRRRGLRLLGLAGVVAAALRHYTFEVESFETLSPTNPLEMYDEAELGV